MIIKKEYYKCLICNEYIKKDKTFRKIYSHIKNNHKLTSKQYKEKFNLGKGLIQNKKCKKCKKIISENSISGMCKKCYDKFGRIGENNPFYNKTHTKKTLQKIKKTKQINRTTTKDLWKNDEYRNKVIKRITGLKRTDQFKKEQSIRIKEWYKDNPIQKEIRSKIMKSNWKNDKIPHGIYSINKSKKEKELCICLKNIFINEIVKSNKTLKIGTKWYYPDIIINDKIIIEFFGNYWHGNPMIYKKNEIVHHNTTAKTIWKRDEKRLNIFKKNGYLTYIVWEYEFDLYKENITKMKFINEIKGDI